MSIRTFNGEMCIKKREELDFLKWIFQIGTSNKCPSAREPKCPNAQEPKSPSAQQLKSFQHGLRLLSFQVLRQDLQIIRVTADYIDCAKNCTILHVGKPGHNGNKSRKLSHHFWRKWYAGLLKSRQSKK
jgi:hypothetical protein